MAENTHSVELTQADVDQILQDKKRNARNISIGVGFVFFGVIVLLFMLALSNGLLITNNQVAQLPENLFSILGITALLLCITVSVAFFVKAGISEGKYEYLEKNYVLLDHNTKTTLVQHQRKHADTMVRNIVTGITFIMLGIIAVITFLLLMPENEAIAFVSVWILLAFIAIGTAFFITAGMLDESYKQLLNHNKSLSYDDEEKTKVGGVLNVVMGYYWVLVTIAYFLWSWLAKDWKTSWIIWPIAALSYSFIAAIAKTLSNKKK